MFDGFGELVAMVPFEVLKRGIEAGAGFQLRPPSNTGWSTSGEASCGGPGCRSRNGKRAPTP